LKKSTKAAIALTMGVGIALSTTLPSSAATILTGSLNCTSNNVQKSTAAYSVTHYIYSQHQAGGYSWSHTAGSTYVVKTTSWNGAGGKVLIRDGKNSNVSGPYLSSASMYCA
jgi:hypothetical protein